MSRLAGTIDGMIGVDTHRDTLLPLSPLRQPAGPAGKVAGAPHDRSGAALHRPGRIQLLAAEAAEAAELGAELSCLVASIAPWLLELPGVGPVSAAQVLVRWSHACQLRS